jgi:hypothetical protein
MKKIFQYFLIFIGFISVISLGVYALDVQSKTLTTIVSDGYHREGSSWRFIVSEPKPFLGIIPVEVTKNCTEVKDVACALLDIDAIQKSVKIN